MMKEKDGKGIAAIVVSRMKKGKGMSDDEDMSMPESEEDYSEESEDGSVEYEAAADDLMTALDEGDTGAVAEALKSFFELCKHGE